MLDDAARDDGVRQRYNWQEIPPSVAIIETIERYTETTPGTKDGLSKPLGNYLEMDALKSLVCGDLPTSITFGIEEYTVTITKNTVRVTAAGADTHDG